MEKWKDIDGYDGLYQVSDLGNIKRNGKSLSHNVNVKNGYHSVTLCKDGKPTRVYVHRLVALAFIPNPKGLPQVNHKDECKGNNRADNLEWCTRAYNNNYGKNCATERLSKTVVQMTKDGEVVCTWKSAMDAEKSLGYSHQHIAHCCKGERRTANGFVWQYA